MHCVRGIEESDTVGMADKQQGFRELSVRALLHGETGHT